MGRLRVVCFHIQSFESGSPLVSSALLQQALSCVLAHIGFMGSHKISSVDGR
jgi:hypothetical protein